MYDLIDFVFDCRESLFAMFVEAYALFWETWPFHFNLSIRNFAKFELRRILERRLFGGFAFFDALLLDVAR